MNGSLGARGSGQRRGRCGRRRDRMVKLGHGTVESGAQGGDLITGREGASTRLTFDTGRELRQGDRPKGESSAFHRVRGLADTPGVASGDSVGECLGLCRCVPDEQSHRFAQDLSGAVDLDERIEGPLVEGPAMAAPPGIGRPAGGPAARSRRSSAPCSSAGLMGLVT